MTPVSTLPPSAAAEFKGAGTESDRRAAGVAPFALILAVADDAAATLEPALATVPGREDAEAAASPDPTLLASPLLFAAYLARTAAGTTDAKPASRAGDAMETKPAITAAESALPTAALPTDDRALPRAAAETDLPRLGRGMRNARDSRAGAQVPAVAIAAPDVDPAAPPPAVAATVTATVTAATGDAERAPARRPDAPRVGPGTVAAAVDAAPVPAVSVAPANAAAADDGAAALPAPTPGVAPDTAHARDDTVNAMRSDPPPQGVRTAAPTAAIATPAAAPATALPEAPAGPIEAPAAPAAATLAAPTPSSTSARPDAPVVATPVGAPGWTQDVAQHLSHVVTLRGGHAELQLTPPNLGPIEVRISFTAGEPTVAITAADPGTRAALEQSLPQLRELLANQGITLGQAFVQGEAQRREAYAPAPRDTPDVAATAAAPIPVASARSRGDDRLVDTFA